MKTQNDKESNTKQTYFRSKEFSIIFILIIPLDQSKGFFILYALFIFSTNTLFDKEVALSMGLNLFSMERQEVSRPPGWFSPHFLVFLLEEDFKTKCNRRRPQLAALFAKKKDPSNWMDRENFAEF